MTDPQDATPYDSPHGGDEDLICAALRFYARHHRDAAIAERCKVVAKQIDGGSDEEIVL